MTGASVPPLESRFVEIGDATLHYQVAGRGPNLVLLHGLSGSTRWWARNVPTLARRCRVHVVDLIGFGGSRAAGRFVLHDAASHLIRWLDHLGLDRASLIGHSMGGFIAADLTAAVPGRIDRLVLVDAVALPLPRTRWRQALGLCRGLWRLPVDFLPVLVADAHRAGPATILRAARELLTADMRAQLSQVAVPTLLVWGERDALVPMELGERLAQTLPHARLVVVPGAGHNPMWDRADTFNRLVLEFLTATSAPPSPVHSDQPAA